MRQIHSPLGTSDWQESEKDEVDVALEQEFTDKIRLEILMPIAVASICLVLNFISPSIFNISIIAFGIFNAWQLVASSKK